MCGGGQDSRDSNARARIRALNDALRTQARGGRILFTRGVHELPGVSLATAMAAVRTFDAFDGDNDPHGEHDMGFFRLGGERLMWKIDYCDNRLEYGSPDPSDPRVTMRVLTIMLAAEY